MHLEPEVYSSQLMVFNTKLEIIIIAKIHVDSSRMSYV